MRLLIVILAMVCVLALAATIAVIVVGSRSFEGIVVDKPYETGLSWDETERTKAGLGWKVAVQGATLKEGWNDLFFTITDKNGALLTDATAAVSISRPSTAAYDKIYPSRHEQDGRYHASIELPLFGNWDITIEVVRNHDHVSFKNAIFAEQSVK